MLEPMSVATAFATIVSLLADFRSESRAEQSVTIDDYKEWLRRHDHQQLVELIEGNSDLTSGLSLLLRQQHDAVMEQLTLMFRLLADLGRRVDGVKPIATALGLRELLSPQALSILEQTNAAGASRFVELPNRGGVGPHFRFKDGSGNSIEVSEPQFVDDDLDVLCDYGCLLLSENSHGQRIFTITRIGAGLAS